MKSERIDLRVTREEKMAWFSAAQANKMKLADWIRQHCNDANMASFTIVEDEPITYTSPKVKAADERKPCKHGLLFCKKCA